MEMIVNEDSLQLEHVNPALVEAEFNISRNPGKENSKH